MTFWGDVVKSRKCMWGTLDTFSWGTLDSCPTYPTACICWCVESCYYSCWQCIAMPLGHFASSGFPVYIAMHICIVQSNLFIDNLKIKQCMWGTLNSCPTYPTADVQPTPQPTPQQPLFLVPAILLVFFTAPKIVLALFLWQNEQK